MIPRKIVSLTIALSFTVLVTTGILSYFQDYSRVTATLHTVFGILFAIGVLFHIFNNYAPIQNYIKGSTIYPILGILVIIFIIGFLQLPPLSTFMDFGAKLKANTSRGINQATYDIVEMDLTKDVQLSIDLMRSEHYWHPQMAVWVEDTLGNYIETIFVTKATAEGLFFGGRSKDNFKEFDQQKDASGDYRRVDALPVWSHKRGVQYADGMYVPPSDQPLPDGISGATMIDNFRLMASIDKLSVFNLKLEINVAFDDNESYSEFDFPDDDTYHNGTGQLGQPSIIYTTQIDLSDNNDYYLMNLIGHGHHSGQTGEIYTDLSKLTTAKSIVERIVVGVKSK